MNQQFLRCTVNFLVILTVALLPLSSHSQDNSSKDNPVLFTFGHEEVRVNEFQHVYEKNNMNEDSLYTLSSLEDYLDLYINFRLKVREAERLGLDTLQSIQKELATYRKQLAQSYLTDKKVTEKLLKEAYERTKEARKVSHILIKVGKKAPPEDTLEAYERAMELKNKLKNGASFAQLAKQYSDDPSAKKNKGQIGYITAFQTVYPFENTAFTTPVGEVSDPVRTRYGYHLVKVEAKKPAGQKLKAAHILQKLPDDATRQEVQNAKQEIEQIYQKVQNGADFQETARKHSEDQYSAKKGGVLPEFGVGKMVPSFEDVAFRLEEGEVSEPFRTQYGWHIIKLIDKSELPSFQEMKGGLKKKVKRNKRSNIAKEKLEQKIKNQYNFQSHSQAIEELKDELSDLLTSNNQFPKSAIEDLDKPLFKMKDTTIHQKDFARFMNKHMRAVNARNFDARFSNMYENYVEKTLMAYERDRLEKKYPAFKILMKEYRDGILLFELTDRKVWTKAIEDTMGLGEYYQKNKGEYMWEERAKASIYTVKNPDYLKKARRLAKRKRVSNSKLKKKLNSKEEDKVIEIEEGKFERDQNRHVKQVEWEEGLSKNMNTNQGEVVFVQIHDMIPPEPKSLKDSKGYVVSDYQEYLEQRWIDSLRKKYPVQVNKEVLRSLAKEK